MKSSFPDTCWLWLALIGLASFLTWGAFGAPAFSGFPFGGFSISVNAWSGSLTLFGIQLPNWLAVVAAFGAFGVAYARSTGTELSSLLPKGLLIYALAHVALFGILVWGNGGTGRGTLGIGTILMFIALVGLWRSLAKVPAYSPSVDAEFSD